MTHQVGVLNKIYN